MNVLWIIYIRWENYMIIIKGLKKEFNIEYTFDMRKFDFYNIGDLP